MNLNKPLTTLPSMQTQEAIVWESEKMNLFWWWMKETNDSYGFAIIRVWGKSPSMMQP